MSQKKNDKPEETLEDNPLLGDVLERNIRTLWRLRREGNARKHLQDKVADAITDFSGRLAFVYVHVVWFGAWILLNTGRLGIRPFDRFPYGLLTMVVSLEAIFLATFVLISQNRLAAEADRRADLDLQIGLLTEHEVTRVLQMLDAVHKKLEIVGDPDSELSQLEQETRAEDVLEEIARVGREAKKTRKIARKP